DRWPVALPRALAPAGGRDGHRLRSQAHSLDGGRRARPAPRSDRRRAAQVRQSRVPQLDGLARRRHAGPGGSPLLRRAPADQHGRPRVESVVSRYAVNSLLYRLKKDEAYRARFVENAAAALAGVDLTDAERAAF